MSTARRNRRRHRTRNVILTLAVFLMLALLIWYVLFSRAAAGPGAM